jgi:esterase/lipase
VIKVEEHIIESIPVTEHYLESRSNYQGVFFLNHGHGGSKEPGNMGSLHEIFANAGFYVVSVDAHWHGKRIGGPYLEKNWKTSAMAMPTVIDQTCKDIVTLYEKKYKNISTIIGIAGTSMGGHVVFQMPKYLDNIRYLVPIIGSPDIKGHYEYSRTELIGEDMSKLYPDFEKLAITDLEAYFQSNIFMMNGTEDRVVEAKFAIRFYKKLIQRQHPSIKLLLEPVGHRLTESMEQEITKWIESFVE